MLTDKIKTIAQEQKRRYLAGETEDMEVPRSEFDLGLTGGVFHREEVEGLTVWVYWCDTGETQVRVSVDKHYGFGADYIIQDDGEYFCTFSDWD